MNGRAFYNENDPFAAQWLRNLIAAGHIAPGEVDERSIVDVKPDDVRGYTQCHWFAGIGGWSYALRLAGWPDDRPVWTGSCPCQPFSLAGKRKGFDDERHLWPIWRELVRECDPAIIFGEQVASASDWLRLVRSDLEAMGRAVGAIPFEAASAGADHLRDRYGFVAYRSGEQVGATGQSRQHKDVRYPANNLGITNCAGPSPWCEAAATARYGRPTQSASRRNHGNVVHATGISEREPDNEGDAIAGGRQTRSVSGSAGDHLEWVIGADGKARRVKSGIRLLAHGIPNRVGLLRGFGNAIDPRPFAQFILASQESIGVVP